MEWAGSKLFKKTGVLEIKDQNNGSSGDGRPKKWGEMDDQKMGGRDSRIPSGCFWHTPLGEKKSLVLADLNTREIMEKFKF